MGEIAKSLAELREEAKERGVAFEVVLKEELERIVPKRRFEVKDRFVW